MKVCRACEKFVEKEGGRWGCEVMPGMVFTAPGEQSPDQATKCKAWNRRLKNGQVVEKAKIER